MLHPTPTALSTLLPGYGGSRVLLDAALTPGFDETKPLLVGLAWLTALTTAVALTYRHTIRPANSWPATTSPAPGRHPMLTSRGHLGTGRAPRTERAEHHGWGSDGHDRVPELAGEHDATPSRITGAETVTAPGTVTLPPGQPVPRHAAWRIDQTKRATDG
jgi:hypothetical protein